MKPKMTSMKDFGGDVGQDEEDQREISKYVFW